MKIHWDSCFVHRAQAFIGYYLLYQMLVELLSARTFKVMFTYQAYRRLQKKRLLTALRKWEKSNWLIDTKDKRFLHPWLQPYITFISESAFESFCIRIPPSDFLALQLIILLAPDEQGNNPQKITPCKLKKTSASKRCSGIFLILLSIKTNVATLALLSDIITSKPRVYSQGRIETFTASLKGVLLFIHSGCD